jgi:hypothetical protein
MTAAMAITLFCLAASISVSAQKPEQISATAMGTSTQLGRIINIDLRIVEYSTADDQAALLEAFKSHGSEGLVNALEKMKSKGRIAITGTLGFDVNYIREFKMEDGSRKIRFVTDRPITFGEAWGARRSMDYMITMGEINISKDKGKNTGTLMPAAKIQLDKEGELKIETYQNPWNLRSIKVWK